MYQNTTPSPWNFPVRGIRFEGREKWAKAAEVGNPVDLIPEPDNPYDAFAVKIVTRRGNHQIGYVPKEISRQVSSLIRKPGVLFHAMISEKSEIRNIPFLSINVKWEGVDNPVVIQKTNAESTTATGCFFPILFAIFIIYNIWGASALLLLSVMTLAGYWGWKSGGKQDG